MQTITNIDQACKDNNHKLLMQLLDSIESYADRKNAFLEIINHYENEKAQFPVGYVILFIEFLLKHQDTETAADYIARLNRLNIYKERVAEIIYEYIIEPDETYYRDIFNRNMELLRSNKILFSDSTFDFDHVNKNIFMVKDFQEIDKKTAKAESNYFFIDVLSIEFIQRSISEGHIIYLVYNDLRRFYYLLLFEDMSKLISYVEDRKLLFFVEYDLQRYFANMKVVIPRLSIDESIKRNGGDILGKLIQERDKNINKYLSLTAEYFDDKGYEYYKKLFLKKPSDIRVLLITSIHTELNKHLTRNWYDAFNQLGYDSRLLIENEPYEFMLSDYIIEQVYEFKPDVVFQINFTVEDFFGGNKTIDRSLLWITRYRDKRPFPLKKREGDASNIFFSPVHREWTDELKSCGFSSDKIIYSPEGIDISIFTNRKSAGKKSKYDLVSVNNAGGSDQLHLKFALESCSHDPRLIKVIGELYCEMREIASSDKFIFFYESFNGMINEKLASNGICLNRDSETLMPYVCVNIMMALYRSRVIEWIIDSGITKNIGLWGKGWSNIERFRDLDMGVAEHGEQLADIYRNSRITISDHPIMSLHDRNFEIFASRGFPLIKKVTPENNESIDNITDYFRENEEVVLFHNKDDLLNKIQYYLDNPGEREAIAEKGRQVVVNNFSNTAIARKTMQSIKNYYLKNGNKN